MNSETNLYFEKLRQKWQVIPFGLQSRSTGDEILAMSDQEILEKWEIGRKENTTGQGFSVRGWYHELYRDLIRDKNILDIGCGLAYDSISFLEYGAASVTFADIVPCNIQIVERICNVKSLAGANTVYIERVEDFSSLPANFDIVMAIGSLHHSPKLILKTELDLIIPLLKTGGRWLSLAYPEERWRREGCREFPEWGDNTDAGAPWTEWYDLEKLLNLLGKDRFRPVFSTNFHNDDFVWFDLQKF